MGADQVLIDERRGRRIAARLNLRYTGILADRGTRHLKALSTKVFRLLSYK
ncbi:hypothetical protein MICAG_1380007 [Microcystis aeruginosa PCC 9808]|uniref:Uncharacterized protein n=1 Tax=Microcystis aeruginosa PCC 9808 TaxID=1160284 RepID=I4HHI5_MICAE|nr:hypothetical protein MICAG_1380007 [Microcystis aeruginosa PCC 9808]